MTFVTRSQQDNTRLNRQRPYHDQNLRAESVIMFLQSLPISPSPAAKLEQCATIVRPYHVSTHLPAYKIINATPRPRTPEDEQRIQSPHHSFSSSSSTSSTASSSSSSSTRTPKRAAVTQENLLKIAMATARDEHLDLPVPHWRSAGSTSVNSTSNSCLQSIHEEEEEVEGCREMKD